ncbi:hypothetical protein LIER_00078 [Lithospermum erythrorhizon]|uniref:MADS-box domain-containing protein n=1 Tax=Lithospermum erythrorhizon TaxID=34254 RepID=A0AAV3NG95_LITER
MDPNKKIKKRTMGKQKIEIKKIEDMKRRQVTFTKRRNGLFDKARELCVLTAVSPGKKLFTSKLPNEEAIIDHYMQENSNSQEYENNYEAERDRLNAMNSHIMMDNGRGVNRNWSDTKIEGMNLEELEKFREALVELKKKVELKALRMAMQRKNKGSNIRNN